MINTTHHHTDDIRPKAVAQSFWMLITMSAVILMVITLGQRLAALETETRFDGEDLIELASATKTTEIAIPAGIPPALIGAPRIGPDAGSAASGDDEFIGSDAETPFEELTGAEARGQAALATISYPWQQILPDWSIVFLDDKDGLYGLTLVPDKQIEVYVRDSQTKELLAHVIAHELGHAIDVTLNDGLDRRAWEEARDTKDSQWWPGNGTTDFATGAGDFAESFAAWQVGDGSFRSTLAPPPNEAQIKLLAQLAAG